MNEARQKNFALLGSDGCYFLCLVHLAEEHMRRYIDAYNAFLQSIERGYVEEDCFVNNPSAVLSLCTAGVWNFKKEALSYIPSRDEQEVIRYEWKRTGDVRAHFVVGDGLGNVRWDPLGKSLTVANGAPVSKRIFRRVS